jgi:hypothetical protein
VASTNSID